jgi:2-polyprenyl-3-methyl-5-hydroxy-6-metoxy-1,4-benzoquinol methylase
MVSERLQQVVAEHGPWTAMAIKLSDGSYTRAPAVDHRLGRLAQIALDLSGKALSAARVVDLGCLEGHYAIEFALQGCEVLGIEGRAASVAKCEFARRELGLERLRFVQDDVRSFSRERYGEFDIVLCSGLLYHLPAPDAWQLICAMHEACRGLVIIDTFVSLSSQAIVEIGGLTYHGHFYPEHEAGDAPQEKAAKLWASLDNARSFWFTEPSLLNLLARAGFSSVFDALLPAMPGFPRDRKTYVAIRGSRARVLSSDPTDGRPRAEVPEGVNPLCDPSQTRRGSIFHAARRLLPQPVKDLIKPALRAVGYLPPDRTPWFQRK